MKNDNQIFMTNNPYGFKVKISHPVVYEYYKRYLKWKGLSERFPITDADRLEFEDYVIKHFKDKEVI